ncbi:hypothetical protein BCV70DRAFT_217012 [Testicularia cyperi]|uniref:DUF590-domain-containing protein n=1 Tax=Testicularia cyperi TaxID=1882483 RepID=A0A317XNP4_9BASI|nr:hypothetical protein BCV70DRAFT_217012 [Testicularia cyperi]
MAQSQLPPFAQATAGALGSITSNTLVYPLDLLSTRCQTQSRGRDGKAGYQSISAALGEIVKQNGVKGLYQGLGSDTISNTLSNFLFFYFRSFFMETVKERKKLKLGAAGAAAGSGKGKGKAPNIVITAAEDLAIGALAGIVSRFFTTPLSNVTVRMQTAANPKQKQQQQQQSSSKTKPEKDAGEVPQSPTLGGSDSESDDEGGYAESAGILDVLREIVSEKGWLGLWSGFETAAMLSISPALTFYSTNAVSSVLIPKHRRDKPSSLETFLTSAIGNSISTMIVFPLILCKTRLQWRSPSGRKMYRNLIDVVRKTLKRGGIKGLYQGLDSQLVKGLFSFGTTMMVKARIETLFVMLYLYLRNKQNRVTASYEFRSNIVITTITNITAASVIAGDLTSASPPANMNGIKHDSAPSPPPKASLSAPSNSAGGSPGGISGVAATISEKALPPIQGAAKSVSDAAKSVTTGSGGGTTTTTSSTTISEKDQGSYPIPHSTADSQLADYVLVFQHVAKKYLRASAKVPALERASIASEYERLVARIQATGLSVTSREGSKGSGQILVFVRADDQLVDRLARQEALADYLHGVLSVQPPPPRSSSLQGQSRGGADQRPTLTLTPASRVRLVDSLITLPDLTSQAVQNQASSSNAKVPSGAGLRVGLPEFPHLVDMSAIHDPSYNAAWVKRWSHTSPAKILSGVGLSDLDSIREHFGEDVALYFGFLNAYFQALAPLAVWGLSFWMLRKPFSPIYSLGLVTWACLFVELWRMKERKLAVRWGTLGVNSVDRRRHDFIPRTTRIDPATDQHEEVFEWWRREIRVVLSLPAVVLFASLLAATMTLMFVVEIFVTQLYHGPLKQAVPFIPTALLVVAIPQIMAAWQATAVAITKWENHFSAKSYDYSLTLKRFALQAITAYGALTLSAYVYIPFGESIMEAIVSRGFFQDSIQTAIQHGNLPPSGIDFHINPNRMHTQLFAVSVTSQIIGAFTELALPVIMRKVAEYREAKSEQKEVNSNAEKSASSGESTPITPTSGSASGLQEGEKVGESERRFVTRVRKELELPPYDLFGDYAEMATQFGYITLWSVVWPLSPVMGFVNNFFELRSDAAKICVNNRRPTPVRAETIGPWLEVLAFTAWLAALNNAALVYLFQQSAEASQPGHSPYETTMRSHIHPSSAGGGYKAFTVTLPGVNGTSAETRLGSADTQSAFSFSRLLPSSIPTSGPAGALVAAVLVALTAEHVYGLIRAAITHILERLIWRGSNEESIVRRREWAIRLETLNSRASNPDQANINPSDSSHTFAKHPANTAIAEFWNQSKDVGLQTIRDSAKSD